jgi:ATP-binding cassette subfamily B protein
MIIYPLMDIPMMLVTLTQACVSIDRLEDLQLAERSNQANDDDGEIVIDEIRNINFCQVSFQHSNTVNSESDTKPFAFTSLDFTINRGEKVAIVGQIGSGKTTLLNLVSGVIKPDAGNISVNSLDFSSIKKQSFREKIGYIQQEPVIFSETIKTNIDFWRNKPESLIQACSRLAQFEKEVLAFPEGYLEPVGQRGVTLSGGQRQRLSIARALVGKPELLLMDDITASLDAANEKKLWADLKAEYGDITCLIVTHRMATAMMADRIMVLKDGQIEATGSHQELMEKNATYRDLAHA